MPNAVIVGRLHRVEGDEIVIGGGLRVRLSPGVKLPNVPLETSLTIVAVYRDGAIYADSVPPVPARVGGIRGRILTADKVFLPP